MVQKQGYELAGYVPTLVTKRGRGEPVARPNSQDGKTEATLVQIVLLVPFGSATG